MASLSKPRDQKTGHHPVNLYNYYLTIKTKIRELTLRYFPQELPHITELTGWYNPRDKDRLWKKHPSSRNARTSIISFMSYVASVNHEYKGSISSFNISNKYKS